MLAVREYIERNSAENKATLEGELKVSRQHFDQALKILKEQVKQ
jgi:hypothetical protein